MRYDISLSDEGFVMSLFPLALVQSAELLLGDCRDAGLKIVTAESCTGGLIAGLLTEIPGSSDVVERGFVTYSNEAKRDSLGVPGDLIADFGAVSEPVARAMAEGAINNSRAQISVSVTGVAGPDGGTPLKPVGLVHFGAARRGAKIIHEVQRFGDLGRSEIRIKSVEFALEMLRRMI
jgi:nicotinamide-nucleotide amidase